MTTLSMVSRSPLCILIFAIFLGAPVAPAQTDSENAPRFGQSYAELSQQQKALVRQWYAEYEKITGTRVDPEKSYETLSASVRTTFEAVTHALMKSKLTDEEGNSLGNALDLVKLVESVHGEIPKVRGDQQFRVYVLLTDDALDKLYKCSQFKRIGDNSIYHIGYPINFRQQGGVPSIQISVTRTGLRADIDVDYRSSSGPFALVNGHLTAANSDVRAGDNYLRHTRRWAEGFGTWWRNLFSVSAAIPKSDLDALSSQHTKPRVASSANVEAAVHDFFHAWLIDGRPQESLPYLSVKANACVAQYGTGESARSGLIRLRVFEHMKQAEQRVGKIDSLDQALQGTVVLGKGAEPMVQPYGKIFAISQIADDVARALDCRKTLGMSLALDLPQAAHVYGHFYGVSTLIRFKGDASAHLIYQIWTREEGTWKIVSWYHENPFELVSQPEINKPETIQTDASQPTAENPELARAVDSLLQNWLLSRNFAEAARFFAPEALPCGTLETTGSPSGDSAALLKWLKQVAAAIPVRSTIAASVQSVEYDPNQKQRYRHAQEGSYLLLRISDDLAHMASCSFRQSGKAVARSASLGDPTFQLDEYQSIFQPRHQDGDRGAVVLTWAKRNGRWMVVGFHVDHY